MKSRTQLIKHTTSISKVESWLSNFFLLLLLFLFFLFFYFLLPGVEYDQFNQLRKEHQLNQQIIWKETISFPTTLESDQIRTKEGSNE